MALQVEGASMMVEERIIKLFGATESGAESESAATESWAESESELSAMVGGRPIPPFGPIWKLSKLSRT